MEIRGNPWKCEQALKMAENREQALKMAANREKTLFTFFGFLPPYIGVSGLLVYFKR